MAGISNSAAALPRTEPIRVSAAPTCRVRLSSTSRAKLRETWSRFGAKNSGIAAAIAAFAASAGELQRRTKPWPAPIPREAPSGPLLAQHFRPAFQAGKRAASIAGEQVVRLYGVGSRSHAMLRRIEAARA